MSGQGSGAVSARTRFGAVPTGPARRYLGDDVDIWCDFFSPETGARVDVADVSIAVYAPDGTLLDPAPALVREAAGEYYARIPAAAAGLWRAELTCLTPSAAVGVARWRVVLPLTDETAGEPQVVGSGQLIGPRGPPGPAGVGIVTVTIVAGRLLVELTDGRVIDAGAITAPPPPAAENVLALLDGSPLTLLDGTPLALV